MNRSTAREIAVHLTFALAFSSESAEDLLARELTPDRFALRAKDHRHHPAALPERNL